MGGDPHFSILLPTNQLICFSIQGEHDFTFNLISNRRLQVNALFVPDRVREEVTWIGALGIVVKDTRYKQMEDIKIRFMAEEERIYIGDRVKLNARGVRKISLAKGTLSLKENEREGGPIEVDVSLGDVGLEFTVSFVKGNHLDMMWKKVANQSINTHGLIGTLLQSLC